MSDLLPETIHLLAANVVAARATLMWHTEMVLTMEGLHSETIHLLAANVVDARETRMWHTGMVSTMEGLHPETIRLLVANVVAARKTQVWYTGMVSAMEGLHPETIPLVATDVGWETGTLMTMEGPIQETILSLVAHEELGMETHIPLEACKLMADNNSDTEMDTHSVALMMSVANYISGQTTSCGEVELLRNTKEDPYNKRGEPCLTELPRD